MPKELPGYEPIENHGVIGNMRTVALVSTHGSIDWLCLPRFDSPTVFGALLDRAQGGHFSIAPTDRAARSKQLYWSDTNVLLTRFLAPHAMAELTDFMPVGLERDNPGYHWLVRRVTVTRGTMQFRAECHPAFDYARAKHRVEQQPDRVLFIAPDLALELCADVPLEIEEHGAVATFTLSEGQSASFVLCAEKHPDELPPVQLSVTDDLFRATVGYWRRWLGQCTYRGRWREIVHRSALVLKLLTYEPTGAIVAAATTSLPEEIGGERNWDYRFTWIRDAAFTLYALMRIGFTDEAARFMGWLEARLGELNPDGSLQIMYGIDGRHELEELSLDHLEGYRQSVPVRVGNGAYGQLQLDIYGELLDSVYLYNKYGVPISYGLWVELRRLVDWVCEHWREPDEGVWEVRGGRRHFVFSKLMCWVALDRALRLADKRSFPADYQRWRETRDAIYLEIMTRGWSEDLKSFTQSYDGETLDASLLLMPSVFFLSPGDPRTMTMLESVARSPREGGLSSGGLVYRYDLSRTKDGLLGEEGTFNICTFWMVEAMTRAGAADPAWLERGRLLFEHMLGYANHLGLYAEETGDSGEALGNFPQAFTHLALISAAFNLDRALGRDDRG